MRESFTPLIWWDKEIRTSYDVTFHFNPSFSLRVGPPSLLDVETPGVVLVIGQAHPVVLCDDSLVQTEDSLVTSLHTQSSQYIE